jgi:pimeloyl-ACP methyl ester carboxylesterase
MAKRHLFSMMLIVASLAISNCSSPVITGITTSTARGTLLANPVRIASFSAELLTGLIGGTTQGAQLLQLVGPLQCGIDYYYIHYWTRGGAGEITNASGALMVPTGGTNCTGPRPVVLYAHGTTLGHQYNIADITNTSNPANAESALISATYAAQGFIVVAPNYAGYDVSSLSYHPYLNAAQQSGEMIDALVAARTALPTAIGTPASDGGQLLLAGYSQGGYVAMATMKAMQAANLPVTAIAAGSGPYALEAFGDAIVAGNVNFGATVLAPLLVTSYQHAYGNIYANASDLYSAPYASYIETLLPTDQTLLVIFGLGLLPLTELFDSTTPTAADIIAAGGPAGSADALAFEMRVPADPLFAAGFGPAHLVNNSYRINYILDAASNPDRAPTPSADLAAAEPSINNLRKAFYVNDMRNGHWAPHSPMFLCGGVEDPTVFFENTRIMQRYWSQFPLPPGLVTVFSVDPFPAQSGNPLQTAFAQEVASIFAGGGQTAVVEAYHSLVAPFCAVASLNFFRNVL